VKHSNGYLRITAMIDEQNDKPKTIKLGKGKRRYPKQLLDSVLHQHGFERLPERVNVSPAGGPTRIWMAFQHKTHKHLYANWYWVYSTVDEMGA